MPSSRSYRRRSRSRSRDRARHHKSRKRSRSRNRSRDRSRDGRRSSRDRRSRRSRSRERRRSHSNEKSKRRLASESPPAVDKPAPPVIQNSFELAQNTALSKSLAAAVAAATAAAAASVAAVSSSATTGSATTTNTLPPSANSGSSVQSTALNKEEEQVRLEIEMKKRRERVEKWRAERKLKDEEQARKEFDKAAVLENLQIPKKKWTLDEESDEEDVSVSSKPPDQTSSLEGNGSSSDPAGDGDGGGGDDEQDDVDPLDLYMQEVNSEVQKIKGARIDTTTLTDKSGGKLKNRSAVSTTAGDSGLKITAADDSSSPAASGEVSAGVNRPSTVVIRAVAARAAVTTAKHEKGELMEQNQDGLEYSSEEEEIDLLEVNERLNQKGKKDLIKIDHNHIVYQPFRKNFWVEVPELKAMTSKEVEAYRAELEGIKVKGKDVPKPLKAWSQAGLRRKVMDVLKKSGYEKPTPIQAQAIPIVLSGRDMIGIAKTGSGKTLAFVLPMLRHIADQPPLEDGDGPIAIIMAPTRELCLQIGKECRKFAKTMGIRTVCVYGGTGISEQIAELKRGAELIVCTPGRMIDMLAANSGRVTNLTRVTYIVLDEADRMFDMGFEPQVMRVIDNVRPDRQCVLFSATFPRQMEALARRILLRPIEVLVGGRSVVCKDVEQHVIILEEHQKFFKLLELLGKYLSSGSAIVFVDKQEAADDLLRDLIHASYPCLALHGGVDQYDRDSIIVDFKNGKTNLLVATSVAARGLDVKRLVLVVNYDCPNHYEDYVHRCGRTGRAGNHGYAYTLMTAENVRQAGDIIKALELSETDVPADLKKMWEDYKIQQTLAGKKVKSGGGFGGRGFKFDDSETQIVNDKKQFEKVAHGMQDSDEDDNDEEIDEKIENLLSSKRIVKEIKPGVGGTASTTTIISGGGITTSVHEIATSGGTIINGAPLMPNPPGSVPLLPNPPQMSSLGLNGSASTPLMSSLPNILSSASTGSVAAEKLELARQAALRISASKMAVAAGAASFDSRGQFMGDAATGGVPAVITSKMVAEQLAAKLNNRLNYVPEVEKPEKRAAAEAELLQQQQQLEQQQQEQQQVICKYEEELEINDFPQHTRWKVTSKETLAQICEYSEAGITVRGTYFQPGTKLPDGERKLYLAIESTSEMAVSRAKAEITRLIKEELLKAQTVPSHLANRGRYKVI